MLQWKLCCVHFYFIRVELTARDLAQATVGMAEWGTGGVTVEDWV